MIAVAPAAIHTRTPLVIGIIVRSKHSEPTEDIGNTAQSWLVVGHDGEQDAMTLLAETAAPTEALSNAVAATLQMLTKMRGEVKLSPSSSLPDDVRIIAGEQPAP
jgi:hypothetical protein